MAENTLSVLKIAPGQYPKQIVIDNDLKALQQAVDGPIAASYPFEDPVAIVYNDEGRQVWNLVEASRLTKEEQARRAAANECNVIPMPSAADNAISA